MDRLYRRLIEQTVTDRKADNRDKKTDKKKQKSHTFNLYCILNLFVKGIEQDYSVF